MVVLRTRIPQGQGRFPAFRAWGRLLWKEWREDWLPLLIGVGLPLLSRPLWDKYEQSPFQTVYFLIICLTLLWAIYRTQNNITSANARTALPVPGFPRWFFTIPVPIIIPAVVGMVFGSLIDAWPEYWGSAGEMGAACALYLMAGYALCALATSVFTAFPAVLIGGAWVILTNVFKPEDLPQKAILFVPVIIGALLAQAAWEAFSARLWFLPGRIVIATALVWLALFPLGVAKSFHRSGDSTKYRFEPRPLRSPADQVSVEYVAYSRTTDSTLWRYETIKDAMKESGLQHGFADYAQPLAFRDTSRVLVAQQQPDEDNLHLLEWDVTADTVREIAAFRPGHYALYEWGAEASPDGQYLLFFTKGSPSSLIRKIPIGYDLWIVDIAGAQARLAAVGMMSQMHKFLSPSMIRWSADRVIVPEPGTGRAVEINLVTLHGRVRTIRRTDL